MQEGIPLIVISPVVGTDPDMQWAEFLFGGPHNMLAFPDPLGSYPDFRDLTIKDIVDGGRLFELNRDDLQRLISKSLEVWQLKTRPRFGKSMKRLSKDSRSCIRAQSCCRCLLSEDSNLAFLAKRQLVYKSVLEFCSMLLASSMEQLIPIQPEPRYSFARAP